MNDPIRALSSLEPESPPREVVLASLRLFRYRTMALVATIAVGILGLVLLAGVLRPSVVSADVRAVIEHSEASFRPVHGSATIGTVRVTATELAVAPSGDSAIRLVFEDKGSQEPMVDLDIVAVRSGGVDVDVSPMSIQSLGRSSGRTTTAVWIGLPQTSDPIDTSIEILVLPIPNSVVQDGGVLTSDDGITGVVHIERTDTP